MTGTPHARTGLEAIPACVKKATRATERLVNVSRYTLVFSPLKQFVTHITFFKQRINLVSILHTYYAAGYLLTIHIL